MDTMPYQTVDIYSGLQCQCLILGSLDQENQYIDHIYVL